jgi:ABC-type branched-subunit amino acid transport system ATPase component
MFKVKTFTTPIQMFATVRELQELDERVTAFLNDENVDAVYSVSDAATVGEKGETIGLIRTVAYSTAD